MRHHHFSSVSDTIMKQDNKTSPFWLLLDDEDFILKTSEAVHKASQTFRESLRLAPLPAWDAFNGGYSDQASPQRRVLHHMVTGTLRYLHSWAIQSHGYHEENVAHGGHDQFGVQMTDAGLWGTSQLVDPLSHPWALLDPMVRIRLMVMYTTIYACITQRISDDRK